MKAKTYTVFRNSVEDELQFERSVRLSFEQETKTLNLSLEKSRETFWVLTQIARNFEKTCSKPRERARYKAMADVAYGIWTELRDVDFRKSEERKQYDEFLMKDPLG